MIIGSGVDVVTFQKIKRLRRKPYWDSFRERIFSKSEIEYCNSKEYPEQHYSSRWAIKESFVKATSDCCDCNLSDVSYPNYKEGIKVNECVRNKIERNSSTDSVFFSASLSHEKEREIAVAHVIIYESI